MVSIALAEGLREYENLTDLDPLRNLELYCVDAGAVISQHGFQAQSVL